MSGRGKIDGPSLGRWHGDGSHTGWPRLDAAAGAPVAGRRTWGRFGGSGGGIGGDVGGGKDNRDCNSNGEGGNFGAGDKNEDSEGAKWDSGSPRTGHEAVAAERRGVRTAVSVALRARRRRLRD